VAGGRAAHPPRQWQLGAAEFALLNAVMLGAAFLGALAFGRLADAIGRTRVYWMSAAMMVLAAVGSALTVVLSARRKPRDDLVRPLGLVALDATRGLAAWVGSAWWGGCPGRFVPPLYYRNNVARDATKVRVAGMADVPGAGGHEEDSLAITERYRIR
jgi:MFS family permease